MSDKNTYVRSFGAQRIIPSDLSPDRYISGFAALNLPAPQDTSGDWHFPSVFYAEDDEAVREIRFIAGTGGRIDTNRIYGSFGVYAASRALMERGLRYEGTPYSADHFRAVLDYLYLFLTLRHFPANIHNAAWAFFDTREQQELLLTKAKELFAFCDGEQARILRKWLDIQYRQVGDDGCVTSPLGVSERVPRLFVTGISPSP